MPPEEIKVGETYNVRVKVLHKSDTHLGCCTVDKDGQPLVEFMTGEAPAFYPINSPNGTKNTEPAPKYDPCRKFRKGDIVRVVEWNGRAPIYLRKYIGTLQVVEGDEDKNGVACIVGDIEAISVPFLELDTPVEELKPYTCGRGVDECLLYKNKKLFAEFENPKDAARVCKMLNGEHRKEQNND